MGKEKYLIISRKTLIIRILAVVVVVGVAAFATARHHFILMDSKIKILKKAKLDCGYTFVDARGTKRLKLVLNPKLAKAGVKNLFSEEGITIGE